MSSEQDRARVNYMKLSQDATNEIWSVILRADHYPTPAAKKRAVEHEIRSALEAALNVPSTVDGFEDGLDFYGRPAPKSQRNPYENTATRAAAALAKGEGKV